MGDILFAGEMAGLRPLDDGFYVRPATPPPFQHEIFRDSIAKATALDASLVCLGHYGCRQDAAALFERAGRQLDFWVATAERHFKAGSEPFEETILADLIALDPDMAGWQCAAERHPGPRTQFLFQQHPRDPGLPHEEVIEGKKCLSV
ncbi:MAG: hypothetical protein MZU91_04645 [Desulfosudis oleivorans]|nr:hypothetical protein [Desulfosudis oleivorans]